MTQNNTQIVRGEMERNIEEVISVVPPLSADELRKKS